jgi:hypothetical protein
MASPATIHVTHSSSHFFREHSTFPEGYQARRLMEGAMSPYRAHPYQRERSHSPPTKPIDYRSSRIRESALSIQQARPASRGQIMMLSHDSITPPFTPSSRSSNMFSEPNRIAVGQLVDRYPSSRPSNSQRDAVNPSLSSARGLSEQAETARLPGIGSVSEIVVVFLRSTLILAQLLGLRPENERHEPQRYAAPPASSAYQQPRYQGHSTTSSMSSAFSEPVSPSSYGGHASRSPIPQHPYPDDRGRTHSQFPYASRDEPLPPSQYEPARSQTLPFRPIHSREHSTQYEPARSQTLPSRPTHSRVHSNNYPPPPPPSGPNTMLPPPPDPFYLNVFPHQRPPYSYTQPHPSQLSQPWDRPRVDSAMPLYDHPIAPPGYGWGFPGHHAANSMTRKRRGNLPKEATKLLKDWFGQHNDSPYPTEDEKQDLCRTTGLQISQVRA